MFFKCETLVGCFRSQKRYFYCNIETGQTQWQYPEMDVHNGSDDAMDISTTPPPPEEADKILILEPPPPPRITRASTPPPPIISSTEDEGKISTSSQIFEQ